jgi:transposase
MDKAGWHTASDLVAPENLSLLFLPPYSPELNPIERLWLHSETIASRTAFPDHRRDRRHLL